ncbi:hypothetical protein Patl1_28179 [Pistacia atlantica]|uniref:Uncharacterized protein n=1 Tax=Pistacia atlantica TaxID=434234 RepID=A0ACC1BBY1_9ROSI|nr:hypothetical protein Patl1_28179 [Pistacia atlantica]
MDFVCGVPAKAKPLEGLPPFRRVVEPSRFGLGLHRVPPRRPQRGCGQPWEGSDIDPSVEEEQELGSSSSVPMREGLEEVIGQFADHLHVPMHALAAGVSKESWAILLELPSAALL